MRTQWIIGGVLGVALAVVPRVLAHFEPEAYETARSFAPSIPYLLIPLSGLLALYFLPRYRRSKALTDEGLQLLSQGRVAAALDKFEASRPLAKSPVIPTYNIGISRLQLWQLSVAERELAGLEARTDLTPRFRELLSASLAMVSAMDGRVALAEKRLSVKTWDGTPHLMAVLASGVVACRTGRWAEALEQLGHSSLQELTGPLRGLREALEAWCQEHLTGEQRPVDAVAVFGEASPDVLEACWPELVTFLLERSGRREAGAL
ncbi:hypothetical protein [Corallococcus terminator]|uniref:Tetratricopeptide repeat protein n=1 Tax=Corallococcus terminator TaxID=2316733 RepID=A0A3A8IW41_9BACT|nr:hypothetical protein [Corallococcus terminator]RKG87435.1 hypothetical protein D7V88_15910 [Corallococcus terminator]